MIEELRVSFFAQQLGTPYPISISGYCRRWSRFRPRPALSPVAQAAGEGIASGVHPREGKPIPAFAAHGLQAP
jgi:hypothetical protein